MRVDACPCTVAAASNGGAVIADAASESVKGTTVLGLDVVVRVAADGIVIVDAS